MSYNKGDKVVECTFLEHRPNKPGRSEKRALFLCRCGQEFETRIKSVESLECKSCGCYNHTYHSIPKINYQRGDKIGVLTFLTRVPSEPEKPKALFLCECGKEFVTRIDAAKDKSTKSCGCKSKEMIAEASRNRVRQPFARPANKSIPPLTDDQKSRFWAKVALTCNPNKCWNWLATGEYGGFRVGKSMFKAHRIAYFLVTGEDPSDMELLHSCDNSKCCNPAHLSPGTHWDNMQDMKIKGRAYNGKIPRLQVNNVLK